MRKLALALLILLCLGTAFPVLAADSVGERERYWGQWRGPHGNGVSPHGNPPAEWSEKKNVRWKIDLPGEGHATPIIWGDTVYVALAVKTDKQDENAKVEEEAEPPRQERRGRRGRGRGRRRTPKPSHYYQFTLLALDRKTGSTQWTKMLREQVPHEGTHSTASMASISPATDGEHLIAHFGSRGLFCLDLDGNEIWSKDLGKMTIRNTFGEGSSPVLHGDTLVIVWDHEGDSFIVALDKKTGKERWKLDRDERTSWSTPLVLDVNGKPQVIVPGTTASIGYDLATGKKVWKCSGLTANVIPTPVWGHGLVYLMSGYRDSRVQAIRYEKAKGDITEGKALAWSHDKNASYVPSALLYGDNLYFVKERGAILTSLNAKTGKPNHDPVRLGDINNLYASPVGAAGRIYVAGQNGTTIVFKNDGSAYTHLKSNTLDDSFDASPAVVDGELYLRGHENLYCIAEN